MKKTLKRTLSIALTLITVFALSLTAFAAEISASDAKAVALKNAGYSESQVKALRVTTDYDDGRKYYDVGFNYDNGDGSYFEYDYEILAADGRIVDKDVDKEYGNAGGYSQASENGLVAFFRMFIAKLAALFGIK